MKCGGCVGHVKQLLEQHPSVTAATVNLATETALVRVKLEPGADLTALAADLAKVRQNEKQQGGKALWPKLPLICIH
jgi:copper chaperone CopZ